MINVHAQNQRGIIEGPIMAEVDKEGNLTVPITSCYPAQIKILHGEEIGTIENIHSCERRELNPEFVNSLNEKEFKAKMTTPLTEAKRKFIRATAKLDTVPEKYRDRCY